MSPFDQVAFGGAVVTGLTVFARAELLGPRVRSSYASNPVVRLLMDAVALTCAFVAFELWGGASVPDAVAWFIVLCGVTSTAMLISMFVHDGRVALTEVKAVDVADMKEAVAEVVPAAVEAGIPQVIKDLAVQADPYRPGEPGSR